MSDFVQVYMDKPLLVPFAVLLKPFRPKCFETYQFHHASAFNTPQEEIPAEGISVLDSREQLLKGLGYKLVGLDLYRPPDNNFTMSTSLLYSSTQQTMSAHCICYYNNGWKPAVYDAFTTLVEGDQYVITSNVRGRLPNPSYVDAVALPGRSAEELNQIHQTRIASRNRIWGSLSDQEVKDQHMERLDRNYSYFNERGIYGPLEDV